MCSLATRLCIEQAQIQSGPLTIYYPSGLIPLTSIRILRLFLHQGSIPLECLPRNNTIATFEINNYATVNEFVNSTVVEIPRLPETNYYFQLQDLSQTVCILGPDLYGSRVPFVALSNPPITSTVSTPTATPLVTPRNQATDENWLKGNTLFILLLSLLIIGILFSICLYFYRKKHTKYRPTVETIRSPSVDTIIRVETEPQLTTFAKQLIQDPHQVIVQERISVDSNEYQSFKSTSYQSSSFISAEDGFKSSLESGSFKTAEEYFTDSGSEQSIDLDIDELFDDKASTVTIKGL